MRAESRQDGGVAGGEWGAKFLEASEFFFNVSMRDER